MASNPPGQCCTLINYHEGKPAGTHKDVFGLDTYVTESKGTSDRFVVILTDIYGHKLNNVMLVADQFAKCGYTTYIPDILKGDPMVPNGPTSLQDWLSVHSAEVTRPIVDGFLSKLREEHKNAFIGVVGHCFGAKYAIQNISAAGFADAAAVAHPSFVSIEEVAEIKKPLIIAAAETDPIYTADSRHQTEAKLMEIKARYQSTLFSGVSHGFAVRGDMSDPVVEYSARKALSDQIEWFGLF